jgi:hypothetical protein
MSSESFSLSSNIDGSLRVASERPMYTESNCEVVWHCEPAESGVDLTFTISNPTTTNQAMPTLLIDGLDLGDVIDYLDHRTGCKWATLDATGGTRRSTRRWRQERHRE